MLLKTEWETGAGLWEADRHTFVIQPVISNPIAQDWNLSRRTIVPTIDTESPLLGGKPARCRGANCTCRVVGNPLVDR
jgi:hypothetical protein